MKLKKKDIAIIEIDLGEREIVLYSRDGNKIKDVPTVVTYALSSPVGQAVNLLLRLAQLAYNQGQP